MRMPEKTREAMFTYAQTLPASTARAMCYKIGHYSLETKEGTIDTRETIAERIERDHVEADGHLRAAALMVHAGCAKEIPNPKPYLYGKFVFEDGSEF